MADNGAPVLIGIYGSDECSKEDGRGCGLWPTGYAAALTAAGATPVPLDERAVRSWGDVLDELHGVVFSSRDRGGVQPLPEEERFCQRCRRHSLPLLCVNHGLQVLNAVFGGTLYLDLAREFPEALQHRHPPEKGLRHAIEIARGTRLAQIYGEGELVVNSEHRRAVRKVARGFRTSAQALDGVIEAIEADNPDWFALGVQWHPASGTASGLDIQLFRALVDEARARQDMSADALCTAAA
jgi:putative glutamine amidotransferase